jgi:hydrogenase nickel incorporation protein HypB
MCATCGCGVDTMRMTTLVDHDHAHDHPHGHDHRHDGDHRHDDDATSRTIQIEQDVLAKNDVWAGRNRSWLAERDAVAINLMSSPGSGKTTLVERTIRNLAAETAVFVVEGDQETLLDAERIRATGRPVVQINTGAGCHLDAAMLERGLHELDPPPGALILVENVGNLVCPALFDLGESRRVVVMSVTEGDDKPLKYPHMFAAADLVVVNKIDLLPYVDFDVDRCAAQVRAVNPGVEFLRLSATRGAGLHEWYRWLEDTRRAAAQA